MVAAARCTPFELRTQDPDAYDGWRAAVPPGANIDPAANS